MKEYSKKHALVLILGLMVAVLTACTSTSYSTPTPMPMHTPTPPSPSMPTQDANTPPAQVPGGQSVTVNISALNYRFDKSNITVPSGANVTMVFDNKEAIPHNVAIYTTSAATEVIFKGEVITGPKTISYNFIAPTAPGDYFFRCDVHPTVMTGTFTVTQ
jgi:plastocyanin